MENSFTKNDYRILKSLMDRDDKKIGLSRAYGTTINELAERTGLSTKKIRNTIKLFVECGFVSYGIKRGNATTYILTEEGFLELKSIRVNIFGKVDN